ncbi:proton-conducting transporter transmembrane domain-containing protein [Ollibium composti]|uniref:NADH:quinone oxidoreductase/Mrp antiporter transmembrane domain-containing protein n=1 Tax=Ollibium composti TaxID=2675109 RepID=A0ABY2Q902_9HYPH|nr:proton-conducting transporter membrane subunit [Mesorhizobium composti]THF58177.1 hypothetical protein E6C48_06050 [Mesorhizobium composti]
MSGLLLILLVAAPAIAAASALVSNNARLAEGVNLLAAAVSLACAILLVIAAGAGRGGTWWAGYILLDVTGAWVVLCGAVVYLLASIYAIGYMRLLDEEERLPRFYALFAAFALTILAGPLMNNAGLYWIAIELTTLVSTFLVAFERDAGAMEAAWKYIIVVSAGISVALLGTVILYWGGSLVLGPTYDLTWQELRRAAPEMNPGILTLAFLLVLVGYGTKVGLAPMHTWLPDAHSESPAPVSAMLSGALLNAAMLGIVRFLSIVDAAKVGSLPRGAFIGLGLFSVLVGTLFIVRQRGVKRLMAYSSVEHMGIMALGFGFGGPLGVAGALYHMLNHSLNKSLMFFGAGNAMRAYGTKRIAGIGDVMGRMPSQGGLWLAGAAAITGAPPFGLFLSELTILRAGFHGGYDWIAWAMALLLIVIFIGFLNHFRIMYFEVEQARPAKALARLSTWCIAPMWLALLPLLAFGVWWPQGFSAYFDLVAHSLLGSQP